MADQSIQPTSANTAARPAEPPAEQADRCTLAVGWSTPILGIGARAEGQCTPLPNVPVLGRLSVQGAVGVEAVATDKLQALTHVRAGVGLQVTRAVQLRAFVETSPLAPRDDLGVGHGFGAAFRMSSKARLTVDTTKFEEGKLFRIGFVQDISFRRHRT